MEAVCVAIERLRTNGRVFGPRGETEERIFALGGVAAGIAAVGWGSNGLNFGTSANAALSVKSTKPLRRRERSIDFLEWRVVIFSVFSFLLRLDCLTAIQFRMEPGTNLHKTL